MKTRHIAVAAATLVAAAASHAYEFQPLKLLGTQDNFRLFSEDVSAAMSYRPIEPSDSLGLLGFDVGANLSFTKLNSVKVLEQAADHSLPSTLPTATLRVSKGIPFIDANIGATYTVIPAVGVNSMSVAGNWAVIAGGVLMPAVSIRGAYTKVNGITGLKMDSTGVDLSISKGFLLVKPYAGVGVVKTKSTPDNTFAAESYTQNRVFVGANFNLLIMDIAVEADKTGKDTTYSAKLGFRF